MKRIVIDPGHGGSDRANRGPTGYVEADGVLDISLKLRKILADSGYTVIMTREKDETVALYKRAEKANAWKGDLFLSIHTNAAADQNIGGVETFHTLSNEWNNKAHADEAKKVAQAIQNKLVASTGLLNRGIKTRLINNPTSVIDKKDYYAVIRRSNMAALIIEVAFHSNSKEEALLKRDDFRNSAAHSIASAIKEVYPLSSTPSNLTMIMGEGKATLEQMVSFALKGNPKPLLPYCSVEELAKMFIEEAQIEGVRADVAFAQSLKETGYFRYGGIVLPDQNNYAGIGALNNNAQGDAAKFESPRIGVRAQIQHLKAYASTEPLKLACKDPRFNLVKRGCAKYVEHLGASDNPIGAGWAWPGKGYGYDIVKIVNLILAEPRKVEEEKKDTVPAWQREAFEKLVASGKISTPEFWENRLGDNISIGEAMAVMANMI